MTVAPDLPRLSVVIAALDAEATLGRQLAALRAQRPPWPWEVLVSDNGSTDGTCDLVRTIASATMPELRHVDSSGRRGPSAARNAGVRAARADGVAFCDADDVVGPGWVEAMGGALASGDLVVGRLDHQTLNPGPGPRTSWQQQVDGPLVLDIVPRYPCGGAGCLGVGRTAFLAVDGFCTDLLCGEDVDLCWRMQLAGARFVFAPEAVVQVGHRRTLGAVYRQMVGWAVGDRLLRQRYAQLRRAGLTTSSDPPDERPVRGPVATADTGRARPLTRRLARLRTSQGRADAVARAGHEVGRRFARRSASVSVLTLEDVASWREAYGARPRPHGSGR